mmetsp:Transcript_29909/g.41339  ORF Transcript_29909/g.41339 Transcript_29909/m.41339 type:complete len:105 (+) Transcript_29909:75-389(+)|eukprot:CAMPEP_0201489856 /NCGR_PEP_ID=MMETSP0151_2-20130828/23974_1 /ASSEMBLY_ACC=CAM_ASM_000257 /TAXON_ID=200890 /ORGANISM="Paramoeba atlantica, Strain 621/1 / CCAP 1560/9" /LENGTH=104 /DNA_ID=CAMNT_0047875575 /DNA_START=73 /DNA_END=387 /DNA_ORIENTATION=+
MDYKKQLKITTASCKRLSKDIDYYKGDAEKQKERIQKMKENGADEYDIKKQDEVLVETMTMIPDSQKRYDSKKEELQDLMKKAVQEDPSIQETTEYQDADAIFN